MTQWKLFLCSQVKPGAVQANSYFQVGQQTAASQYQIRPSSNSLDREKWNPSCYSLRQFEDLLENTQCSNCSGAKIEKFERLLKVSDETLGCPWETNSNNKQPGEKFFCEKYFVVTISWKYYGNRILTNSHSKAKTFCENILWSPYPGNIMETEF